jgi:hypothetical protein
VIPVEEVPDEHELYYRIHVNLVRDNGYRVRPNCFRDLGGGMSTDWSKYSTPDRTRSAKGDEKAPSYGIVALGVSGVRAIQHLSVIHAPLEGNDAHTNVHGLSTEDELLTQQRAELYDVCGRQWVIAPDDARQAQA